MKLKMIMCCVFLLGISATVFSQQDKSKRPSPPGVAEGTIAGVNVKVDYSRPFVKGRKIFGDLEKYGNVWRTGANEATVISFDKDVMIEGKKLAAGSYTLFSIPGESEWTIIFNSALEMNGRQLWGTQYGKVKDKDVLRVTVKPSSADFTEQLTFDVGANAVSFMWENTKVSFKVKKA